ncbi:MAG TPA: SsrA-binding protein SmpB [bacterium]|nr:SsrA-binding protein SmpB [bacterium]HPG35379.1 SsrA-binding protein SmpB [bacterium]HPV20211.1 SsrA-binding protein SmpB [bacterium]HRQ70815.1 SsrA-binding protein SmpB [bacterium]
MGEIKIVSKNKKISRAYEIIDKLEAGIVLQGTEIKSIRDGNVSFRDSFVDIVNDEMWLIGFYIAPYTSGNIWNHAEDRKRKLLLNKREIRKWDAKVRERGFTVVPVDIYLKDGKAKMTIGLARGKTSFDRKSDLKERDIKRDTARFTEKYK